MLLDILLPAAHAAEKGGMPQLDPSSFASQIFWLIVSFSLLYVLMSRSVIPRIREVLEKRSQQIMNNLDSAEDAKKHAEDAKRSYEKELEDAKNKAHQLIEKTQSELSESMNDELYSLKGKLDAQLEQANAQLAEQRKQVMQDMEPMLNDLTSMIIKHIGNKDADASRVNTAVKARLG